MLRCDDVLQLEHGPRRQQQRQHHGKTAKDRAGNEVGRENCRMPRRQDGRGEVK